MSATYRRFAARREDIMLAMITDAQVMHGFDVYRGTVFDHKKFAAFLARTR